jgi:pseudouridylate synthase
MINCSEEVQVAIDKGQAVVALESTIIAHGMPYPQNLAVAREAEQVIRKAGAIPATIAILDGELRAGLSAVELETFAKGGQTIAKVSTRDIPYIIAKRLPGATTVASTMRIADMAGIRVFATGGMGGVHRGARDTFDISNDLTEFQVSSVAVVTAGAKAILDLGQTLEVLETLGVPVIGCGTDEFPAFYSRKSGHKVPMRADKVDDIAQLMKVKWDLAMSGGIVVANPIPAAYEIPAEEIEPVIEKAIREANKQNIIGRALTPFLLKKIVEATEGRSLKSNIALMLHNAKIAADVAVAYAKL